MPLNREDNAALFWNKVFLDAALADSKKMSPAPPGSPPPPQNGPLLQEQGGPTRTSRAGAIVHLAIHDAVNGIDPYNAFYIDPVTENPLNSLYQDASGNTPTEGSPIGNTSAEAAGAAAARHALVALYPSQQQAIDGSYANFLALKGLDPTAILDLQIQADIEASIAFGIQAATNILNARANDGADDVLNVVFPLPTTTPWYPDVNLAPPGPPLDPHWGNVRFFTLPPGNQAQLRPRPFLLPDTSAYNDQYWEVYIRGSEPSPPVTQTVPPSSPPNIPPRDAAGTEIAKFWSYDDKLGTPIRLYNESAFRILSDNLVEDRVPNPPASLLHYYARIFALINVSMADAGIACWEAKYAYNIWRPFQGILLAYLDGNPATDPRADWRPLGRPRATDMNGNPLPNTTPNFPAYVSGHSCFGTAMLSILRKAEANTYRNAVGNVVEVRPFTITSEETNTSRMYNTLDDAIDENGESRILLGVHWRIDNEEGILLAEKLNGPLWDDILRPNP